MLTMAPELATFTVMKSTADSLAGSNVFTADSVSRYISLQREKIDQLRRSSCELERENERLRSILANGDGPCVYCNLPASDIAKCSLGFPGCSRADDMLGMELE